MFALWRITNKCVCRDRTRAASVPQRRGQAADDQGWDQASGMPSSHPLDNFPTGPKIKRRSPDCFEFIKSRPWPGRVRPAPSPRPHPADRTGRAKSAGNQPAHRCLAPGDSGPATQAIARETPPLVVKIWLSGHTKLESDKFPALPPACCTNGDRATTPRDRSIARETPRARGQNWLSPPEESRARTSNTT